MKGIDVSSWNGCYNDETREVYESDECDFVLAKATEGTGYVNPYCVAQAEGAEADGKLVGVYHYARGGDYNAEAQHFAQSIENWWGKYVPALDFEQGGNNAWGDYNWALNFCTAFHTITQVWPLVYIQASAVKRVANCADYCGLWIAGYPNSANASWDVPAFPYSTGAWPTATIWQYTSAGGVDRNTAYVTAEGWRKIAQGDRAPNVENSVENVENSSDYVELTVRLNRDEVSAKLC